MSKILFEVNYNVIPEKRTDYLEIIDELKIQIKENSNYDYFVMENKKINNNFSEYYLFNSEEEFDEMEDNQNEQVQEIIEKLFNEFILNKKVTYITRQEV